MESKAALIHKTSVNCSNFEQKFPFPFFVFGEKIRTRAVSCKQMTMVTPIHLLLFGSRRVDWVDRVVRLDNWINLEMNPNIAAKIVALRPSLESLVVRASKEPESVLELSPMDVKVVSVIKELCKLHAGSHGIQREEPMQARPISKHPPRGHSLGGFDGPSPAKFGRFDGGNWNNGGGFRRGFGNRGGFNGRGGRGFRGGFGSRGWGRSSW